MKGIFKDHDCAGSSAKDGIRARCFAQVRVLNNRFASVAGRRRERESTGGVWRDTVVLV